MAVKKAKTASSKTASKARASSAVKKKAAVKKAPAKRAAAKKAPAKKPAAKRAAPKKAAPKKAPVKTARTAPAVSPRTIESLSKKVTSVSADTKSLSKDLKSVVKIFGDNQKILVAMKGMIDDLVTALDAIQKQSKRIGVLESETQKIVAGAGEVRTHARMIAKLDSQAAKLQETVRGMDERTRVSGGIESVSKKVDESASSIKNNAEMIIKIGRHIDKIRDDVTGLAVRASSADTIHGEIAKLKELFEEAQAKHGGDEALSAEISALGQKVAALSEVPVEISGVQRRLEEVSGLTGTLAPAVEELRGQIGRVASKIDSGGSAEELRGEFASLRENVLGRASKVEAGIESVSEALGRSEKSASEFHKKADEIFEEVRKVKGEGERAAGESTGEVMALLRLSEFQSNVRMTAESKYGELSDLERIAEQTVDVLNVFDNLAARTGSEVRLPHGVRQWAVSKILECADRWEIRFSDVLGILRDKIGLSLLKESVRMSQVRDIYGTRAVDELKPLLEGA